METVQIVTIIVAIVTICGSIIGGAVTLYLNKRQQIESEWRKDKLQHYRRLLLSISNLAVDGTDKQQANIEFAEVVNTIALVAPQPVISALMSFHDEAKYSNPKPSREKHDLYLNQLLLEIRKDLNRNCSDDPPTFDFHLVGSAPKS